jgi:hypothetical protein
VTKITNKIYECRRTTGGFGPPFPHQISIQTLLKIQNIFYLSHELENLNLGGEGENKRMRER